MPHHLRRSFLRAAEACRFLCPICEKVTPPNDAGETFRRGDTLELADSFGHTRHLWKCMHCGATHRAGAERVLK
jgi:hypothetical protein